MSFAGRLSWGSQLSEDVTEGEVKRWNPTWEVTFRGGIPHERWLSNGSNANQSSDRWYMVIQLMDKLWQINWDGKSPMPFNCQPTTAKSSGHPLIPSKQEVMPTKTRWAQQFRRSQQSEAIPKKGPDNSRGWKVDSRKRNPVEFSGIFPGIKVLNIVLKRSEWMWVFFYI